MSVHDGVNFPGGQKDFGVTGGIGAKYDNGKPIKDGDYFITPEGAYYELQTSGGYGNTGVTSTKWVLITNKSDIQRLLYSGQNNLGEDQRSEEDKAKDKDPIVGLQIGPLDGQFDKGNSYRWPLDMIDDSTDWVLFQFGKYPKPFGRDVRDLTKIEENKWKGLQAGRNQYNLDMYNNSVAALKSQGPSIMLPVPQDVANEIQQTWQGKQFTAMGRAAVSAAAAGQFANAGTVLKDVAGNLVGLQKSLTKLALNTIPGVGGNISFNDIAGSTRGIVINPNAELLYDSPQMREVGMVFKMVASNKEESEQIYKICQTFRRNASPEYGGTDVADSDEWKETKQTLLGGDAMKGVNGDENIWGNMNNFIRVPNLCKFTFMKGHNVHPWLVQFKPCAISNVEVNYTPDGTYATHPDGAPVSVEIRLSFMETKVVFAQEINPKIGAGTY
jgi:hypothetical protein